MSSLADFDYVEPIGLIDTFVTGVACVEPLEGELVRIWLYAEEKLTITQRVLRVRLVMPLSVALEANAEAGRQYRAIHKAIHPLRAV